MECKEFCTSFVLDSDLVPRLSVDSVEHLRNEVLELIGRVKVPKKEVVEHAFSGGLPCIGERGESRHLSGTCKGEDEDCSDAFYGGRARRAGSGGVTQRRLGNICSCCSCNCCRSRTAAAFSASGDGL